MASEAKAAFTIARERLVARLEAEVGLLRVQIRKGEVTNTEWIEWQGVRERLSGIIRESCELNAAEQILQRLTGEAHDA